MVEPERVLHSVMVIAFERKGVIEPDLKIIRAVLSELRLNQEHATDALDHIRQFRGDGDWSGKRESILGVAISRIEEGISEGLLSNSGITGALKRLIEATEVGSDPADADDPLAAFEEEDEASDLAALELEDAGSSRGEQEAADTEFSIDESSESAGDDLEDIDPFELLEAGAKSESSDSQDGGYTDPLDALMEDDEFEDGPEGSFSLSEDEPGASPSDDEVSEGDSKEDTASDADSIIDMYRMMLDTVWVDDLIDPSEMKLLTRKREELGISFETHLRLVREMLEDGE